MNCPYCDNKIVIKWCSEAYINAHKATLYQCQKCFEIFQENEGG
jgi:DNA-directed RNA polymerase subunit RPC12/RpoP